VDKKLTKLYYTIGEVAEMFEVKTSLIRFWEKEFKVIKPKKNKKGNRLFTPDDIAKIEEIYELVKVKGFTLDGARQQLKRSSPEVNESELDEVVRRLESLKRELKNLRKEL
jgi:DNA-binding transcriptional MerR regulator